MHRLRSLSRGGRLVMALAVGGALFGIASAVQADIPDSGVIHGCYGKAGTPYKGQLRVRDSDQAEPCRSYENTLDWNQTGPSGATGPTGPTGPAALADVWNAQCAGVCQPVDIGVQIANVWTKDLPAGTFLVIGKAVVFDGQTGADFACYLEDAGGVFDQAQASTGAAAQAETLNLQHVVTLSTPDTVALSCTSFDPNGEALPESSELSAIPIGTVH